MRRFHDDSGGGKFGGTRRRQYSEGKTAIRVWRLRKPETPGRAKPDPASQDLRPGLVSLESHPNHQLQDSGVSKCPGTRLRQAAETTDLGAGEAAATPSRIIDC